MNYDLAMPYDAITIDSNVAIRAGLNLESGLLAQLFQFSDGPIDFILSEIVFREIRKHMLTSTKKVRDDFIAATRKARDAQLFNTEVSGSLNAFVDEIKDSREVTKDRLVAFVKATSAKLASAKLVSADALSERYFKALPPFDATGSKKEEFPDAIALLALENWAKGEGKRLLAVSGDKGWQSFAATSEHMDVIEDLPTALELIQQHTEKAHQLVVELLNAVEAGELPELTEQLDDQLREALSEWSVDPDAHGSFHVEFDLVELQHDSFQVERTDGVPNIAILRIGSDELVAWVSAKFSSNARAEFSLSVWDSVDKEYIGMGGTSAEQPVEYTGEFLVTLGGDLDGEAGALELRSVELVEAIRYVDFGEVDFDYGDDFYGVYDDEDAGFASALEKAAENVSVEPTAVENSESIAPITMAAANNGPV